MIGALIGDIVGSRFEGANHKSKELELLDGVCGPTDDSIMSLAVAEAILESNENFSNLSEKAILCMQKLGRAYPFAGYGETFFRWIFSPDPKPYNSFGNGAGMRVSPCGFAAASIEEAQGLADKVTVVTHNHPDGLKGAETIAVAVYLARCGKSKGEIRDYVTAHFYDINFTLDGLRPEYTFDVSCKGSVPVAVEAFYESADFEDAIRNAISVGGDSDTIGAMAVAIAEAYYGVPEKIAEGALKFLNWQQKEILFNFEKQYPSRLTDDSGQIIGVAADVVEKQM